MRLWGMVLVLFCFLLLGGPLAAMGATGAGQGDAAALGAGLPQVSSEDFNGKINRMVGALYGDALEIAPQVTLLVFVIGGVLGIFWREARTSVAWSVFGLVLIMWAPQLIGLVIHYINQ